MRGIRHIAGLEAYELGRKPCASEPVAFQECNAQTQILPCVPHPHMGITGAVLGDLPAASSRIYLSVRHKMVPLSRQMKVKGP